MTNLIYACVRKKTYMLIYTHSCLLAYIHKHAHIHKCMRTYIHIYIHTHTYVKFREHIIHTSRKCSTLIHALAKSAKLSWGLKHDALITIYKGTILPLIRRTSMDRSHGKEM
jgi:hypothetical protein